MDRVDRFRIFVRVFECESFTDAARSLDIPRSTASVAIQELEARVGAQLFHRTTRRVSPTYDGEVLYERAIRLLADIEDAEMLFRSGSRPQGRLKIDTPSRIAHRVLVPALPQFLEIYPQIELEIGGTDRRIDMIQEGVDCVIRVGTVGETTLNAKPLGEIRQINCASPDYIARHGTPESLWDLDRHRLVKFASMSKSPVEDWEYVEDGKTRSRPMSSPVSATDAETYIAFCRAGLGLIQVPAFDVQDEIAAGRMVEVMPAWRPPSLPLNLLWPHRRPPPRRVRVFLDWVSDVLSTAVLGEAN